MSEGALDLFRLDGLHAVISGGAGLLGPTFAEALLEANARVTVLDFNAAALDKLRLDLGNRFKERYESRICDVTSPASVDSAIAAAEASGPINILVNAVALDPKVDRSSTNPATSLEFTNYPVEVWRASMDVNLTGVFLVTQAVCRRMEKRGAGVIVNISSTYGIVGPNQKIYREGKKPPFFVKPGDYSTTKAGVIGFTKYLAAYYAERGIRVNCLSPGGVFNNQDEAFASAYAERTLLGRMARRDEYKGAILFLCSAASSYMTGANLVVDGGWTAI